MTGDLTDRSRSETSPVCEHFWQWVSPAGARGSARLCMFCHQPDADWLNGLAAGQDGDLRAEVAKLRDALVMVNGVNRVALARAEAAEDRNRVLRGCEVGERTARASAQHWQARAEAAERQVDRLTSERDDAILQRHYARELREAAERQVADLRARIEALPRAAHDVLQAHAADPVAPDSPTGPLWWEAWNAAPAHIGAEGIRFQRDDLFALLDAVVEAGRKSVLPDSPDLRNIVKALDRLDTAYHDTFVAWSLDTEQPSNTARAIAVLAVVRGES